MQILIGILVGVVIGILLVATFLISLRVITDLVGRISTSTSEVLVNSLSDVLKNIFGGNEPGVYVPGNEEANADPGPQEKWFPQHEMDDLMFPGSAEEVAGMEAGWAPNRTDPQN